MNNKTFISLPGLYTNFSLNKLFINLFNKKKFLFKENLFISSVYGSFPGNLWGLERFKQSIDIKHLETYLKFYNNNNIEIRYEMNNPYIENKHLDDILCNKILKNYI